MADVYIDLQVQRPNFVGVHVSGDGYLADLYRSIVKGCRDRCNPLPPKSHSSRFRSVYADCDVDRLLLDHGDIRTVWIATAACRDVQILS